MHKNYFDIAGKHILVTGASSGIGKAVAIELARVGAVVSLTGRDAQKLKSVVDSITNGVLGYVGVHDLTQEDSIKELVTNCEKLDGVVFCAGIAEYAPIKILNIQKLQKTFDINYSSQVALTSTLLKHKKLNTGSSLVYVSSISSKKGVAATASYASSKAALSSFVKVLATEVASPLRIRANSLCPGIVDTPMGQMVSNLGVDVALEYPLGIGEPIDVANACIFFLSDASKWITGSELVLDGGLTLK